MTDGSRKIQVCREGIVDGAKVTWQQSADYRSWTVTIESAGFGKAEAQADDAFEALCIVREELELFGWRIGAAGAQVDVWPSGMARDQGGGLGAFRIAGERVSGPASWWTPP